MRVAKNNAITREEKQTKVAKATIFVKETPNTIGENEKVKKNSMLLNVMVIIGLMLIGTIAIYMQFAFSETELNAFKWGEDTRVICILFMLIYYLLATLFINLSNITYIKEDALLALFAFVVGTIVIYLLFSFVKSGFDIFMWEKNEISSYFMLNIVYYALIPLIIEIYNHRIANKNKQ